MQIEIPEKELALIKKPNETIQETLRELIKQKTKYSPDTFQVSNV
jgi:hypothetical protein